MFLKSLQTYTFMMPLSSSIQDETVSSSENFFTLRYWFGEVDTRWVAIFRIFFAGLLLKDALYHLPLAKIFYSDEGVIPRVELFNGLVRDNRFSLMDAFGQPWMAFLFFCVWIIILVLLLVGYRVRLMAVLNFVIILSVHERNGYILTGADTLMRSMSFWLMFAPVGQYYAVDAIRRRWHNFKQTGDAEQLRVEDSPLTAFALPVRILQWQLVIVYCSTAYLKSIGDVWLAGETLHYIRQIETFILPAGEWLRHLSPDVLQYMTWGVLGMEFAIPVLLLSPFLWRWTRALAFLLAVLLHGGIAITLSIQDFSILMLICYLPFFAPSWLDWLQKSLTASTPSLKLPFTTRIWHPLTVFWTVTTPQSLEIDGQAQDANTYDDWQVQSSEETVAGVQAWRAVAGQMAFSRLWRWLLFFKPVRSFLWWAMSWVVSHYERKPVQQVSITLKPITQKRLLSLVLLPLFGLVIMWNIDESASYRPEGFNYPRPVESLWQPARNIIWYSGLWQYWDLFAPLPIQYDGWLVVEGNFENGFSYDLFTDAPVDYETATRWYWGPQMRWEKYEENVYRGQYDALLRGWGNYYCNTLNRDRVEGTRLATLSIEMVVRDFHAPNAFPNPYRQEQLWFHWCYDEYAPQS